MANAERPDSGPSIGQQIFKSPAVQRLGDELGKYVRAQGVRMVKGLGKKATSAALGQLGDAAKGGGGAVDMALSGAKKLAEGQSPGKVMRGAIPGMMKRAAKKLFGRGGGQPKMMNIIEDVDVGVPVSVAYNQWTQYKEFPSFMKGVQGVDAKDEVTTNWKIKVFKSNRAWDATVKEQVPDRRIRWESKGAKGTTKGVVSFHPLADDLTKILLVMEYYPSGFFEKTGNLWRAGGRRTRLDLKHFRRFIAMRGEETGSWRGEIHDGEVVRQPEEEEEGARQIPTQAREEAPGREPQRAAAQPESSQRAEERPEEKAEQQPRQEEPEKAEAKR